MKDPYQTLGIARGASDDEVKKAYRAQCKRWHPDLNPNNPTAEEKFKDVQAAYDAITKGTADMPQGGAYGGNPYQGRYGQNPYGQRTYSQNTQSGYRQQGGYQSYDPFGFGFGGFGGFGGQGQTHSASYNAQDTAELQQARMYIVNGQYAQARTILNSVTHRNARWYYLSALCYNGLGQNINALQDARMAVQMEPNNTNYRTLLAQLQNPGQNYQQRTTTYNAGTGGNWCFRLILLNFLLNCLCGGGGCGSCCRFPFYRGYM